jgi:hypothetical protein
MAQPRAADDFVVIRARLVELQRERDQAARGAEDAPKPKPYNRPLDGSRERKDQEEFRPFRDRFGR